MGLFELEKLKFDWKFVLAGFKTTKCCATGTCEIYVSSVKLKEPKIERKKDSRNAHFIQARYGVLRSA